MAKKQTMRSGTPAYTRRSASRPTGSQPKKRTGDVGASIMKRKGA